MPALVATMPLLTPSQTLSMVLFAWFAKFVTESNPELTLSITPLAIFEASSPIVFSERFSLVLKHNLYVCFIERVSMLKVIFGLQVKAKL